MIYLIITYILNIIDYICTQHWVNKYGVDIEANPIGKWMFETNTAWAIKIIGIGILLSIIGVGYELLEKPPLLLQIIKIITIIYSIVVISHLVIIIRVGFI